MCPMIFFAPCAFLKPSQPKLKSAQTRASPNSSQPKPQSAQTRASPNSSQPKLKSAQTQVSPCGSKTSPDEEQRGQRELRAIWAIQLTAARSYYIYIYIYTHFLCIIIVIVRSPLEFNRTETKMIYVIAGSLLWVLLFKMEPGKNARWSETCP